MGAADIGVMVMRVVVVIVALAIVGLSAWGMCLSFMDLR